ncbi:hypothetical protein JCM8547_005359 [Rhodosporidiobolus lusitaniae]
MLDLDACIQSLLRKTILAESVVKEVTESCKELLMRESNVIQVQAPVTVVGDLHGQFYDLIEIFRIGGYPPHTNYLFLGDYVDRGLFSVETISLWTCLKLRYPDRIQLIRGDHESRAVTQLPPAVEDNASQDSPALPSSRFRHPSFTILTFALTAPHAVAAARTCPSPTLATFRFFGGVVGGPKTPKSPSGATSPRRDYFPPHVSATTAAERAERAVWAAEREKERLERKAREEREREARERERDLEGVDVGEEEEEQGQGERVGGEEGIADILGRREVIIKLARAFMIFGAPYHRLEARILAAARVLELPYCVAMYLSNLMLINLADPATRTSGIKQPSGLDFGKLMTAYYVYNKTIRDKLSVSPPNFFDMLAAIPHSGLLVLTQVFLARNTLYSSLFEIFVCVINSAMAVALSYTKQFCYYSISAGSVVIASSIASSSSSVPQSRTPSPPPLPSSHLSAPAPQTPSSSRTRQHSASVAPSTPSASDPFPAAVPSTSSFEAVSAAHSHSSSSSTDPDALLDPFLQHGPPGSQSAPILSYFPTIPVDPHSPSRQRVLPRSKSKDHLTSAATAGTPPLGLPVGVGGAGLSPLASPELDGSPSKHGTARRNRDRAGSTSMLAPQRAPPGRA